MSLTDCGIIQPNETVFINFKIEPTNQKLLYVAGEYVIIANVEILDGYSIPVYVFTKAGNELLKLVQISPPKEYLSSFAEAFNENKEIFMANLQYAKLITIDGTKVSYSRPLLDFPIQ